jgi:hypothetical protein
LFQATLNQALPDGKKKTEQEINSLQQEIKGLQAVNNSSQNIGLAARSNSIPASDPVGLDGLATSALMKLNAISPRLRNLIPRYSKIEDAQSAVNAGSKLKSTIHPGDVPKVRKSFGELGSLAARFESGDSGVGAIGYDKRGGTSYGIYQISSRAGTMQRFLDFLEEQAPDWARRLNTAGPSNTGGRSGAMPSEWQRIAKQAPERFARLQHDFIEETHYLPAARAVYERTGIDIEKHSPALQEVLWSTAVQHGARGAARLFCKALDKENVNGKTMRPEALIDVLYSVRGKQFGSSSSQVQAAVQRRFAEEKTLALAMLADDTSGPKAQA